MAISATQIATTNTLENFRQQFNNLQTDVNGLESGTLTFSSVSATTLGTSALNILEDGTVVFEGATDDGNETTLTVADPTADRTITLPDATGTVFLTNTTDTAIFSDKTALASADVASGTDLLLIADINVTTLKKITVDNLISSAGGLTALSGDSTPQLGGDLDVNGNGIVSTSNANISITPNGTGDVILAADTVTVGDSGAAATLTSSGAGALTVTTGGAADLVLSTNSGTDSSSLTITDAANGNISATLNGTAVFQIDGTDGVEVQQGAISIKNGGSESYVRFYCESSNAHYTQLQASPHSAYSGNVTVVLPAAATNLVGDDTTQTLTNKTITSAQVNTALLPASADGATLGSATKEFSDLFLADASTIQFGNDQEITLTHVADTGLTITNAISGTDDRPIVLQLKSEENAIVADDVIASIEMAAGDADGTDGATVAAGIHAIAEGTFSASANATKLVFTTGVSETAAASATAKMTLSSAGLLTTAAGITSGAVITSGAGLVIADAGTIGSASDTDAIAIASNGVVTFSQSVSGTSADFDGGVTIDNITIDGTEIDLSSGDLTIDVAGDITLDADGADINFADAGTTFGKVSNSSSDFVIKSTVSNKDMLFKGNDDGTTITALTLDMSGAGAATFNNNVTAFSDERLKSDIQTIEDGLTKVEQLRGVTYIRNDNEDGGQQVGVIAQEVEKILPQVVLTAKDDMKTKSVDYGRLTGVLIEAVKELSARVKELEDN